MKLRLGDFVRKPSIKYQKPVNFEKMLEYSRLLSSKFCFVRIDFYEFDEILYLGEMTFAPFNVLLNYNDQKTSIYSYLTIFYLVFHNI